MSFHEISKVEFFKSQKEKNLVQIEPRTSKKKNRGYSSLQIFLPWKPTPDSELHYTGLLMHHLINLYPQSHTEAIVAEELGLRKLGRHNRGSQAREANLHWCLSTYSHRAIEAAGRKVLIQIFIS